MGERGRRCEEEKDGGGGCQEGLGGGIWMCMRDSQFGLVVMGMGMKLTT